MIFILSFTLNAVRICFLLKRIFGYANFVNQMSCCRLLCWSIRAQLLIYWWLTTLNINQASWSLIPNYEMYTIKLKIPEFYINKESYWKNYRLKFKWKRIVFNMKHLLLYNEKAFIFRYKYHLTKNKVTNFTFQQHIDGRDSRRWDWAPFDPVALWGNNWRRRPPPIWPQTAS